MTAVRTQKVETSSNEDFYVVVDGNASWAHTVFYSTRHPAGHHTYFRGRFRIETENNEQFLVAEWRDTATIPWSTPQSDDVGESFPDEAVESSNAVVDDVPHPWERPRPDAVLEELFVPVNRDAQDATYRRRVAVDANGTLTFL